LDSLGISNFIQYGKGGSRIVDSIQLLIWETKEVVNMKNINPCTLTHFHGLASKYLSTFLFEFEVLCNTYDYNIDALNLGLFPSNLKEVALQWFMSINGKSS